MNDKPESSKWKAFKAAFQGQKPEPAAPQQQPDGHPAPAAPSATPAASTPDVQSRDDTARLAALYRVSRTLGTSLELDEVLAQVMDAVIGLTGAERGILVLMESDSKEWTLRLARNFDPEKLSTWETEVSRTIINTAVETRQGVVTADAQSDPRFSMQASVIFNVLRSMMCAPLLARGRLIGAIYVDSRIQKGIFDESDLEMLDAFATQAAFAIDNARIYTRTVQKVQQLTIELDEVRKAKQVAEITDTEYFRKLQAKAETLRRHSKENQKKEP
jgi:GAF domain-containing protein